MKVLETLGKIIPPPAYILLPSVGVDVSDTSLKYIKFKNDSRSGTELLLQHWGDIEIAQGALERGAVNDGSKLTQALREVKNRTGIDNVRVSLPEERAYLFETEIDKGVAPKEIKSLLEFRLEENVPLSPRDAFFDYDIIEDVRNNNTLRVCVTAYARDTVMSYYDACVNAGVVPISFEVEAQAIARSAIARGDIGTHMIVDFGKTRAGVGIVHRGVLMYTSTIDVGGAELSASMRKVLGDVDESELTRIKNEQGLIPGVGDSNIHDILVSSISSVVDEIAIRIQYWNTKDIAHEDRQIQSVILCGGSANMKGLPAYLTHKLGVDTKRANVWQNAFSTEDKIPQIDKRHSFGYATAIGLALPPSI